MMKRIAVSVIILATLLIVGGVMAADNPVDNMAFTDGDYTRMSKFTGESPILVDAILIAQGKHNVFFRRLDNKAMFKSAHTLGPIFLPEVGESKKGVWSVTILTFWVPVR